MSVKSLKQSAAMVAILVGCAAAGLASLGCESLGLNTGRDRDRDRSSQPDNVIGRDPVRSPEGSSGVFSGGAGSSARSSAGREMSEIPTSAVRVRSGSGEMLTYTAEEQGRLYVYDATNDRVLHTTPVGRGDRVTLDPAGQGIIIERLPAGTARAGQLSTSHEYHVYFAPGR